MCTALESLSSHFGASENTLEVERGLGDVLATRDPGRILAVLETRSRSPIERSRSLLFLDEIQSEPVALSALRYFHEQLLDLVRQYMVVGGMPRPVVAFAMGRSMIEA